LKNDKPENILWHDAFFEALQLEFHKHKDSLQFIQNHPLSKEALEMDVLVIKKEKGAVINKNIGKIFRDYNVFEYKGEKTSLPDRDYNKVVAYALLYSSFTPIPVSDITVSFSVTVHPRDLLKYLQDERGFTVEEAGCGIYYIRGDAFPVQILESKLLPPDENVFLRNLRSNLSKEEVIKTTKAYTELKPFEKKNVYLDRLIQANQIIFEEAVCMSEEVKQLFFRVAEKGKWFEERDKKTSIEIAIRMLRRNRPIEEVVEDTGLPYETVIGLR